MGLRVGPREAMRIAEVVEVGLRLPLPSEAMRILDPVQLGSNRLEIRPDRLRLAWEAVGVEEPDARTPAQRVQLAEVGAAVALVGGAPDPLHVGAIEAHRELGGVVDVDRVARS
ncbi:MAG TPA: hypothetical protein VEY33_10870 [Gemmatimonadota bacterium]|nr:hypothetical protein [Gemmatimonadota bacterium]